MITVHVHFAEPVHIHLHEEPSPALLERVAWLEDCYHALTGETMPTMQEAIDRLTQEVTEAHTVAASAQALVTNLANEIRARRGDPVALLELARRLDESNASLAAAVVANTAPAEAPVEESPTTEQPKAEQPIAAEPVAEAPVTEQPATPTTEQPAADQAQPATESPASAEQPQA